MNEEEGKVKVEEDENKQQEKDEIKTSPKRILLQLIIHHPASQCSSSPSSRLKRSSKGVIWMCRASFTTEDTCC